ncbi:hypothetical protein VDG1235_4870 [Verrucomicrobiia bacterium DG1235]|nr:hypothetical protein VDG1235_4870 [Verrucomicrobiae bacterium DG1235]
MADTLQTTPKKTEQLAEEFKTTSTLTSSELQELGYSRTVISKAIQLGHIERLSRGLYTSRHAPISEHTSLVQVAKQTPNARICLLSALKFHELTSQNPHEVWIAIDRKARKPSYKSPPTQVVRFSGQAYETGIEIHSIEGTEVAIYSVSKTVVDLFRYRNTIGIDVAIEALKEGWKERRFTIAEINKIAKSCNAATTLSPYLETVLG